MALLQASVGNLAVDGAGRVAADGKVYLVDGVAPGEIIEFQPGKKRRGKLRGQLARVVEASPARVAPRCEYFGVCGGCAQQHIAPEAQLALKEEALFARLAEAGAGAPTRLAPVSGAGDANGANGANWNYRRKARLGLRFVPKKGGLLVGFRERNGNYITSLQRCPVLDARLSALLPALHEALGALSVREHIPQVEAVAADNAVALVLRHLRALSAADVAALKRFAMARETQFFLQPGGLDSVAPLWPEPPESPAALFYRLQSHDLTLRFSPTDFIQINAQVNDSMVKSAMELLRPQAGDSVLDLFCGIGNFTLPIARRGAAVVGVEGDRALVERARENAALNGLGNAEFMRLDLARPAPAPFAGRRFGKMLLDPPRSGAAEFIGEILPAIAPRVIVYVSCNPVTLARDAAALTAARGYRLTHAGVIDMFPHTAQVESIARFER